MIRLPPTLCIALLVSCAGSAQAPGRSTPGNRVSLHGLGKNGVQSMAVAPGGAAWISTPQEVYIIDRSSIAAVDDPNFMTPEPIRDMTFLGPTLVVLRGSVLFAWEEGRLERLLELTLKDAKLVGTDECVYIFGEGSVYAYARGKGSQHLFDLPGQVDAVTAWGNRAYFAVGSTVYTFAPGEMLLAEATFPGLERIISLAVDIPHLTLYVCDGHATYALQLAQGRMILLSRGGRELLGFRNDSLYVITPSPTALVRISGISRSLASNKGPLTELK